MQWWKLIIGAFIVGALGWIGWYVTRPVPGMKMEEQGRDHVSLEAVAAFAYNSNPPTSGQHLPTWVKAGIYDTPQQEGELIHSLEHGYVVLHYNCAANVKVQMSNVKSEEATGSAVNESDGCKTLVKNLTELANKKKIWKLIVVPRPQLDTTIALTAWDYIDKFDAFEASRIERFIDYHRDQGPEKTME